MDIIQWMDGWMDVSWWVLAKTAVVVRGSMMAKSN
jgi:hypothetical protein